MIDRDVVTAPEVGSTDPCPEAEPPNRLLLDPEAPENKDTGDPRGRAEFLTESHKAAHREEKHAPATHSMVEKDLYPKSVGIEEKRKIRQATVKKCGYKQDEGHRPPSPKLLKPR